MNKIFTKSTAVLLLAAGGISTASAQVYKKIGANPFTLNSSAALEVESTTKGFLPPRMDTAARGNLNPATGLMIYNTTTNSLEVNLGTPASPNWRATLPSNPGVTIPITNYNVKDSDYTVLADGVNTPPPGGTFILLLPAPGLSNIGKIYIVGKIDDTANPITFSPALKLSKSVSVTTLNYPTLFRIQSDGSNWNIID